MIDEAKIRELRELTATRLDNRYRLQCPYPACAYIRHVEDVIHDALPAVLDELERLRAQEAVRGNMGIYRGGCGHFWDSTENGIERCPVCNDTDEQTRVRRRRCARSARERTVPMSEQEPKGMSKFIRRVIIRRVKEAQDRVEELEAEVERAKQDVRSLLNILQAHQENTDQWLEADDAAVVLKIAADAGFPGE